MNIPECPRDCATCSVPDDGSALVCDVCSEKYRLEDDQLCTRKNRIRIAISFSYS